MTFGFLTLAWWGAKALAVREGFSRFFNKEAAAAIAIAIVVVVLAAGALWFVALVKSGAVAEWQATYLTGRVLAERKAREADQAAKSREDAARQALAEQLRQNMDYAVDLERELARQLANPVCLPASITKELRK
ncbi:MAG: hypothetical protein AB7S70_00665 [Hyphomicrobium sp.]|uniref:hypothetical protein n=1 Tax=Hyphomicrobium sp. TaxID=82 RepID=UPI003D0DD033